MPTIEADQFSADMSAIVRSRIKQLPKSAQNRIALFRRNDRDHEALNEARYESIRRLTAEKGHEYVNLGHYRRAEEQGKLMGGTTRNTPDGPETNREPQSHLITDCEDKIKEIESEIARLQAEGSKSADTPSAESIELWLAKQPSGLKFKTFVPDVKPKKGQSPLDCLTMVREAIVDFQQQDKLTQKAWLTEAEAFQRVVKDIDAKAREGAVDFSLTFRLVQDMAGRRTQSGIKWPSDYVGNERSVDRGLAFAVWLHRDALIERAKRELSALARPDSALTVAERKIRRTEIAGTILTLEREEQVYLDMVHASGNREPYRHGASPLAILQIVAADASKDADPLAI
jgi:hypothetical protein